MINYGGKYSVILKDSAGKVVAGKIVTIKINGKNYSAVSRSNGIATFSLTKAMLKSIGTKAVTIKFAGDINYAASTAISKITVKKEAVKIINAKNTYKFKKSKKSKNIKIALKNSKNKSMKKAKVYLKVKGKTYAAKTNSKGKATFKITKLTKKGTYKAVIKYNGSSYYNKVTKTVKIKIQ